MSLFDPTWFTGVETAATTLGGIAGGAIAGFLLAWRQLSKTQNAVAKELGETGWIKDMRQERADALKEIGAARVELKEIARENGMLHAQVAAYRERLKEHDEGREQRAGACEERVRALSEQVLDQKLANGRLFMALAKVDQPTAERLLLEHMRPPAPKDDKQ
jgi:hypothetical protein